jgi:hypothetical protein
MNNAMRRGVPERPYHRSRGVHLSDIISRISKDSGRLKEKIVFGRSTFDPIDEDSLPLCMFLGLAVEDLIIKLNPHIMRIGELTSDGIAMSPDGVAFKSKSHLMSPHAEATILHEFKATYKSIRHPLEEKINYLQQTKSYCRALETRFCVLWIFHVLGDYTFGSGEGPRLVQHHIEYSPWEIESSWAEILRKKKEYTL